MVAATPAAASRPPANIEDFLWNIHSTLVSSPGLLELDKLKDQYSEHLGHKCAIERFLVVGEGGLAATLKRIPHVVTICADSNGTTCVKATQKAGIEKQQLIEADKQYRKEIMKKNAAKAAAMGSSKAKASAGPSAPPKPAPAAPAEAGKRPLEGAAAGTDAKKARSENEAETLARMLVQGVVRVLQNRAKADKGALPISELEDEFKALWKVPFNLAQAGETDAVSFLQKWGSKVELIQEGDSYLVQLAKKEGVKPKAAPADAAAPKAAAGGTTTAVKAGSIAKTPAAPPSVTAAKSAPAATAAKAAAPAAPVEKAAPAAPVEKAAPAAPVEKAAPAAPVEKAAPAAPVEKAAPAAPAAPAVAKSPPAPEAAAKNGPSIPKRAGGPTRPPASIEDFLWNIHAVIDAYGGPMPLNQLKDAYSQHLGHKCAIERFLVVGEGGLGATLKRIPHVVTIVQEPGSETMLKATQGPGTTKEQLIAADHQYRKQLQQKNAAKGAPAVPAANAAPAAPPAKAAPAPPAQPAAEGERDPKKARTDDPETLARMLVQGVVRVLQNRQKDGKGPLPVENLEAEFKALWKVPFNPLSQAGETDTISFLQKWPAKVEVLLEGGQHVVQLAKKAAEKAKATASKAPAPAKSGAPATTASAAVSSTAPAAAAPAAPAAATAAPAPAAAKASPEAAVREPGVTAEQAAILQQLPELQQTAASMLTQMREMMQKQEALVKALSKLKPDSLV